MDVLSKRLMKIARDIYDFEYEFDVSVDEDGWFGYLIHNEMTDVDWVLVSRDRAAVSMAGKEIRNEILHGSSNGLEEEVESICNKNGVVVLSDEYSNLEKRSNDYYIGKMGKTGIGIKIIGSFSRRF